jgi:hypothetical protein
MIYPCIEYLKEPKMAKCFNCEEIAVFLVQNQGALAQEFCDAHLPMMFNKLSLPAAVTRITETTPYAKIAEAKQAEVEAVRAKKKKAAATPVVEEVVVEEEAVEETPVEETAAEETPAE